MHLVVFDTHAYDREALTEANAAFGHELVFVSPRLSPDTVALAAGAPAVCAFVNDRLDAAVLTALHGAGTRLVALRSAGFNHVDRAAATHLGVAVTRVPEYSPHAVAEHALALLLSVVRKIGRAQARVREFNFSLEGLVGTTLHGKTVGLIGTGRIGGVLAGILAGLGCRVLAHDLVPDPALPVTYVSLAHLLAAAEVVSLHVPLNTDTRHLIDARAIEAMRPGVVIVNTGRGALIDSRALVDALKRGHVGGAALDVYEEEEGLFFADHSGEVLQDDVLARLLTFPNVVVTAHQGFLTHEALSAIAVTTLESVSDFAAGRPLRHLLPPP